MAKIPAIRTPVKPKLKIVNTKRSPIKMRAKPIKL
jgi:hypothetical protein